MNNPLKGRRVAVLVANGFLEQDLIMTQKALLNEGADVRVVSMSNGLVNSWSVDLWGLNFAVDTPLNKALAADYDMLVVPGGFRSVEKLVLTAHTRRFINGFVDAGKPVAIFDDALTLLLFTEKVTGVSVSGPETLREKAEEKGAIWANEAVCVSDNVMTGKSNDESREGFVRAVADFFINYNNDLDMAA